MNPDPNPNPNPDRNNLNNLLDTIILLDTTFGSSENTWNLDKLRVLKFLLGFSRFFHPLYNS